jgi:hypothetical protein
MSKLNLSSVNSLQNETTAVATINNNNTLITQAIENTISRDGSLPNQMNSRLDMNSNPIINLPDATSDQEPVTYGQYVDGITSVNNGVVIDGSYLVTAHSDTMINDRVLNSGLNIAFADGGAKGNFTISVSDSELNALAEVVSDADKLPYFTGSGTADVADFTPFARTLVDDEDAATMRDTLGLTLGTDTQPHSALLDSLNSSSTGLVAKTDADTITPRTITAPASGITVSDGDGILGNPTLVLANDLAALEGLSTTGIIARTATDTATTRTVTGTANEVTVTNGDGISGNPTVSLPNALTFTGKTVTGGTFSSPTINTPTGIVKGDVGLGNVDNTSDATKNSAVATLTNKTLTAPVINSPTGIVKGDVGLGNVDNTSDATKDAASTTLTNKTISGSANTLSNIGNASLSSAADSTIKSNISGSSASPSDNTITAVLDKQLGTTQGTIAYRGASTWDALTPGTSGYFLRTQGTSANPIWDAIPGGGDLLSTNNLSDVADVTTARNNLVAAQKKTATTQRLTSSGTYTPTASDVVWIEVHMVGAGGGGGGAGTTLGTVGTSGGSSTFNSVAAAGGSYGNNDNGGANGAAGAGGSGGTGTANSRSAGSPGNPGIPILGGSGAASYFGGGGRGGYGSGVASSANTGGGGSGASDSSSKSAGGGGGAGEYVYLILPYASSYSYTIGAGGSGGVGTAATGGAGGSGLILVIEHY